MNEIVLHSHRNQGAKLPLLLTLRLECNTPSEAIASNVRINSANPDIPWLYMHEAHGRVACIVGGGPSAADNIGRIRYMADHGAAIFALNNAARFLRGHGIRVHRQIIIDARPENIGFIDNSAHILLASQCHPSVVDAAKAGWLMHLSSDGIEDLLPPERTAKTSYTLVGGGYGVGNTAACAAYVLGFRNIHCFGFDSSHRRGASHAYPQPMNDGIPTVQTEFGGEVFESSLPMRAHAARFMVIGTDLERMGCEVHVHGSGLLPTIWEAAHGDISEQDKYRLMWMIDEYRDVAPGEAYAREIAAIGVPCATMIDFGCGTGRAGLILASGGYDVTLVDFAENCRDQAAMHLPFVLADITTGFSIKGDYGFCTDVMEHIPTHRVPMTIRNIMKSVSESAFFQISTVDDVFGAVIGHRLHNTVKPHGWWRETFERGGYRIIDETEGETFSRFQVRND